METIVYTTVIPFIYPQLNNSQFGFLESRSCLSQLLSSFPHIYSAIDKTKACGVIYVDFRKAFNSLPHAKLLFELCLMGITGPQHTWKEEAILSAWTLYHPVNFLCCLEFLKAVSTSDGSLPFLSADDTKLVQSVVFFDDFLDLQENMLSITNWCKSWNLNLNNHKCPAIWFSLSSVFNISPKYKIMDTPINLVKEYHRDLGIMVDEVLTWLNQFFLQQKQLLVTFCQHCTSCSHLYFASFLTSSFCSFCKVISEYEYE